MKKNFFRILIFSLTLEILTIFFFIILSLLPPRIFEINNNSKILKPSFKKIKITHLTPPKIIKGIYLTSYSLTNENKIKEIFKLVSQDKINSLVIDIKDFSGKIFYPSQRKKIRAYQNYPFLVKNLALFLKKFHNQGIYLIGRIVVFQDPVLAKIRPELALKKKNSNQIWKDNLNLAWLDPAAIEVWEYNLEIAQEAYENGFDEINFDYVRFPSGKDLKSISYPFFNEKLISKREVIKNFFRYLKENLAPIPISLDIFGMTTIKKDDLGIGQVLEDGFLNFDFICPMVYPSHYSENFLGFKNPAQFPFEIVNYSLKETLKRLMVFNGLKPNTTSTLKELKNLKPKIRPWLQVFSLKTLYSSEMVKLEIKAVKEALKAHFNGYLLWNPKNIYLPQIWE